MSKTFCMLALCALPVAAQCVPTVTAPTTETFDAATVGLPGVYPTGWINGGGTVAWNVDNNGTTSANTGPSGDCSASGAGNYMYVETSGPAAGSTAILEAPCTDTTGLANPVIFFCYHMYFNGQPNGLLELQTFDGITWNTIWSRMGDQGNQWNTDQVSVPAGPVQYRFMFTVGAAVTPGSTFQYDCAIDDVRVINQLLPVWATNSAEASFDVNGAQVSGAFAAAGAMTQVLGNQTFNVNVGSNLVGNGHDVFVAFGPSVAANAGGFNAPDGQAVNVDLGSPGGFFLYGVGATPGFAPFPGNYTITPSFAAPLTASGQAVWVDPASAIGLTLSQAAQVNVTSFTTTTLVGDDAFVNVPLPVPASFCGTVYSSIDVSTNGWAKFGANALNNDLSENADEFLNGLAGGGTAAPTIAMLWEDLDMGNRPTSQVVITADQSGSITIDFVDADYFATTFLGNFTCTILPNGLAGVPTRVTIDYTGYASPTIPTEGLVGVTCGLGAVGATALDIVQLGSIVPAGSGASPESLFQNFDGSGTLVPAIAAQAFDLGGLTLTFDDLLGNGSFVMY